MKNKHYGKTMTIFASLRILNCIQVNKPMSFKKTHFKQIIDLIKKPVGGVRFYFAHCGV